MKVYIIQAGRRGPIKIGTSRNFLQRILALRYVHKTHMMFLAIIDGGFREEKALHRRFAHLALGGEWFHPGDDLIKYIDTLPCVREVLEATEGRPTGIAWRVRPSANP